MRDVEPSLYGARRLRRLSVTLPGRLLLIVAPPWVVAALLDLWYFASLFLRSANVSEDTVMKVVLAILSPVAGLLGVVLGWWLGYLKESRNQVRRRLSYWSAMSAEVEECKGLAEAYLRREAKAPLYRLPTTAYDHAWPGLLGDGAASGEEARAILRFYGQVIQINRGLDYAASLRIDSQRRC